MDQTHQVQARSTEEHVRRLPDLEQGWQAQLPDIKVHRGDSQLHHLQEVEAHQDGHQGNPWMQQPGAGSPCKTAVPSSSRVHQSVAATSSAEKLHEHGGAILCAARSRSSLSHAGGAMGGPAWVCKHAKVLECTMWWRFRSSAGSAADLALPEKGQVLTNGEALANLTISFPNG